MRFPGPNQTWDWAIEIPFFCHGPISLKGFAFRLLFQGDGSDKTSQALRKDWLLMELFNLPGLAPKMGSGRNGSQMVPMLLGGVTECGLVLFPSDHWGPMVRIIKHPHVQSMYTWSASSGNSRDLCKWNQGGESQRRVIGTQPDFAGGRIEAGGWLYVASLSGRRPNLNSKDAGWAESTKRRLYNAKSPNVPTSWHLVMYFYHSPRVPWAEV